jgi:hypothetical protein
LIEWTCSVVDDGNGADEAALAVVARHALHDEELVAALASGGLEDAADMGRARSFVDRCTACRALHDDIAAIGAALKVDARGISPAPRDFRLSVDDARRLGGAVRAGGVLATLRRSIASFGRPVGASMAALGIVGLLVGSVSLGAGGAAGPTAPGVGSTTASSAPAGVQAGSGTDAPKATYRSAAFGPESSAATDQAGNESPSEAVNPGPNPIIVLLAASVLLLVGGIGLLVVAIRRNP